MHVFQRSFVFFRFESIEIEPTGSRTNGVRSCNHTFPALARCRYRGNSAGHRSARRHTLSFKLDAHAGLADDFFPLALLGDHERAKFLGRAVRDVRAGGGEAFTRLGVG